MKLAAILFPALLATAAQAQDSRVWSVETPKDNDAWLRYATPDSDDQPLAFHCARGSGQVGVAASLAKPAPARVPASVTVASAPASVTLRGWLDPDMITEGALAQAEFSTRAPVVAAFRKTGLVSVSAQGESVQPPPAPKGMVRKFFGACK